MTKLADELGAMAKAIRTAIEYMPYLDRQKEDDDGDYLPLTLREFYEETWQGSYADELFQDVENVIITALRQPVADEAQRLQDHMEQHHGVCLQASQWDAAITALRQPDAVPGDLVERLQLHKSWRDSHGELNDAPNEAAAAIQSLTAERDASLARVAELEAGVQVCMASLGVIYMDWDGEPEDMIHVQDAFKAARALLEGSKP